MFQSVDDVIQQLGDQDYICDKQIATVVFLAQQLDKPVLVEGPAGVGKTELAKVLSQALGREMIRLQCYEGLDEATRPAGYEEPDRHAGDKTAWNLRQQSAPMCAPGV